VTSAPAPRLEKVATDDDVRAFLGPRAGEQRADVAPVPGAKLSAEDETLHAKCEAAAAKAREAAKKLPAEKQTKAALKAMEALDERCFGLSVDQTARASAELDDSLAQTEMRLIATALAGSSTSCEDAGPNPVVPAGSCSKGGMVFDGPGWSCLEKGLSADDRLRLSVRVAYVYSLHVDRRLHVYEVVARGCHATLKGGSDTELVLRGRLGQSSDDAPILRRAPGDRKR
jgi:hypothetical protein